MVAFCLLTALPHLLYGPGEDALQLTEEYGSSHDAAATFLVMGMGFEKIGMLLKIGFRKTEKENFVPAVRGKL